MLSKKIRPSTIETSDKFILTEATSIRRKEREVSGITSSILVQKESPVDLEPKLKKVVVGNTMRKDF